MIVGADLLRVVALLGMPRSGSAVSTQKCRNCKLIKRLCDFNTIRRSKGSLYHVRECAVCEAEKKRTQRRLDGARMREYDRQCKAAMTWEAKRDRALKKYGLNHARYESMAAAQDGVCAICAKAPEKSLTPSRVLCVDHDHSTGKLRELLCVACNHMIGNANDSPVTMVRGSEYLKRHGK